MEKIPHLTWNPTYSLNVDDMDNQQRKLFTIINHLIDTFENGSNDYLPVFRHLIDYISNEFHQEHASMMIANYQGFFSHTRQHRIFIERIEEYLSNYAGGDASMGFKMISFLKSWVSKHTTTLDVHFGESLRKNPAALKEVLNFNKTFEKPPYLYVVNG